MLSLVALLLLALLGVPVAAAQVAGGEVEVRVAAQRLADGRTEFALQQREADGAWGDRVLPRSRFFPANADVGRWLSSSPLTVEAQSESMLTATPDAGVEVRVAAQRLADGRMEFALQERAADGSWAERRLPQARFFPANADVGRWLSSSALTVSAAASRPTATPAAPAPPAAGTCVLADSVERVVAATFQVQTASGSGTAFYIGNGEWITNHHVVETASRVWLVHGTTRLNAEVAASLPSYDLALLRTGASAATPALGFVAARPALASAVSAVGFPSGVAGTPSLTRGVVSKHAPFSQFVGFAPDGVMIQIDAEVNPGNSGGPIVDDCGVVVGVAVLKAGTSLGGRDLDGIGFGVAAETVTSQLSSLHSGRHYARQPAIAPAPTSATLEITAVCDRVAGATFEACRAAGTSGLRNGQPLIFVRGVGDYDNVRYSVDGGAASDYLGLRGLRRGRHTMQVNERRSAGWTGWSAPYTFTITGAAPLEIPAICNGDWADYDTSDTCFTAGSGGILAERSPVIWTLGVSEWANLLYSIDEGPAIAREDFTLRNLAAGFHTIRVSEQQAAGWTGWSEPYAFTITGAAPVEITAICSRGGPETSDACRVAGASGILAETSPSIWRRGTVNTANDRYSIDGGEAITWEDFTLRNLASGRHHVRLGEQQPAGWTGWSVPYWFTITGAAPLEIVAYCDGSPDGHDSWEQCHASPVTRRARHWLWPRGVVGFDNLRVSIDGGSGVAWDDLSLRTLSLGRHNIRIAEQQAAGWTGWSEPYWFTISE